MPKESIQKLLEQLEKSGQRLSAEARKQVRILKSAIGIQPAVKTRTLHGIDLYNEEKLGSLYIARDQEGMLRIHDGQAFLGYITRYSTPKKPQAFRVTTFIGKSTKNKIATFQYLDQAENNLRKQAQATRKGDPEKSRQAITAHKLRMKYEEKGFQHIDTGGNCTAMYLPLEDDKTQRKNPAYILVTDTGGLKAPATSKDNLMVGIYDKKGNQLSYHTFWKGKRLTSETLFKTLGQIKKHAKKQNRAE